ncbi:MAG TPA: hypothetical protein VGD73_30695 [Pseudonocardia sp.]|jgi:hypothetical protein|uniref:hypothetical protein n=1 Tax=Pseudonocardia sp. TaxID=60912 RepID=UPI002ED90F28
MSAVQICDLLGGGSIGRRPGRRQRSRGQDDKITEFEVIAEPGRLGRLNLAVPEG